MFKAPENIFLVYYLAASLVVLLLVIAIILYALLHQKKVVQLRLRLHEEETLKRQAVFDALQEGQEKERMRLAQELHDGVGAKLSGLKMTLEYLKSNTLENAPLISKVFIGVAETLEEVREISHNLHPYFFSDKSIKQLLVNLIEQLNAHGACNYHLSMDSMEYDIVTSTGKGDGTEKITWEELKGALPRIIMGAIIAITISKPIEIRMFQTEINTALHEKQLSLQKDYERRTRKNFEDRIKDLNTENTVTQSRIDDYLRKISVKDSLYNIETSSGQGGRGKGEGPVAQALLRERDRLNEEMKEFITTNKTRIDAVELNRKKIYAELDVALSRNQKVSSGLDGLLERIKLSHEIAGFWVSLFVTLLFLAIELTPVFFKLMLTKTPYDYLAENRDELIKAEHGIEVRYDYYKDKLGLERHLTIHHQVDKMIYEKIKVTEIQKELTDYAVMQYKEREKKNIDENLDQYIMNITPDESVNS